MPKPNNAPIISTRRRRSGRAPDVVRRKPPPQRQSKELWLRKAAYLLRCRMPWARHLTVPIVLNDGREIVTLNDARTVIRSLPAQTQNNDVWLYTGGLLLEAATSDGPIGETVANLRRALKAEGLI
ncbi:hypothetical protein [Methylocapsa sp. S129]|uniref:hypothetical protein n=1 Tax=Methylocapsa sp. S129 TaxID=1641869 RepID=UPI00131AB774|nr:hypothetical protein [Methylocapsa sp. S129]